MVKEDRTESIKYGESSKLNRRRIDEPSERNTSRSPLTSRHQYCDNECRKEYEVKGSNSTMVKC